MTLTDLRFLQKTQELLLQFDEGIKGTVRLSDLDPQAKAISGIEPISSSQIKLYFDDSTQGIIFDVMQLQGLLQ